MWRRPEGRKGEMTSRSWGFSKPNKLERPLGSHGFAAWPMPWFQPGDTWGPNILCPDFWPSDYISNYFETADLFSVLFNVVYNIWSRFLCDIDFLQMLPSPMIGKEILHYCQSPFNFCGAQEMELKPHTSDVPKSQLCPCDFWNYQITNHLRKPRKFPYWHSRGIAFIVRWDLEKKVFYCFPRRHIGHITRLL
jgi:hypothetical protein